MSPELLDAARAYVQSVPDGYGAEFTRLRGEVERLDAEAELERVRAQIADHEASIEAAKVRAAALAERAGVPKRVRRPRGAKSAPTG